MCPIRSVAWLAFLVAIAGGCSAPDAARAPTLPTGPRRPLNDALAVELQRCRGELHDARLAPPPGLAGSTERAPASGQASRDEPNPLYRVRFASGSSRLAISDALGASLLREARAAAWVELRGRTDSLQERPGDARLARARAESMHRFLVDAGVPDARIRSTWQAAGDPVAGSAGASGRAANRRVEVEVHRSAPPPASPRPAIESPSLDPTRPPRGSTQELQ